MIKKLATGLCLLALSVSAQNSITIPAQSILLPSKPVTFQTAGFVFTIPALSFPADIPAQKVPIPTGTNYVTVTNYVTITNVQIVWVTNVVPNFISSLTVLKDLTAPSLVTQSITNQ